MQVLTISIYLFTPTESQGTSSEKNAIPLTFRMRAATATALGAAAARAKLLADQEDREIECLAATIIETQVIILVISVTLSNMFLVNVSACLSCDKLASSLNYSS